MTLVATTMFAVSVIEAEWQAAARQTTCATLEPEWHGLLKHQPSAPLSPTDRATSPIAPGCTDPATRRKCDP